jgi:hypothetical protein
MDKCCKSTDGRKMVVPKMAGLKFGKDRKTCFHGRILYLLPWYYFKHHVPSKLPHCTSSLIHFFPPPIFSCFWPQHFKGQPSEPSYCSTWGHIPEDSNLHPAVYLNNVQLIHFHMTTEAESIQTICVTKKWIQMTEMRYKEFHHNENPTKLMKFKLHLLTTISQN